MEYKTSNGFFYNLLTVASYLYLYYGESGNLEKNYQRYYSYLKFKENDKQTNIDLIPELSASDLFKMILTAKEDYELINELRQKKLLCDAVFFSKDSSWIKEQKDTFIRKIYKEIASELGLLHPLNKNSFFRWIINFDCLDDTFWKKFESEIDYISVSYKLLIDSLVDRFIDGYIIEYPQGKILKQPSCRFFFRGENAYYRKSKANIFRNYDNLDSENNKLDYFINRMRIEEFSLLLNKFDIVKYWGFGDVLTESLAQHYGFKTEQLDITSDLLTALFFACCKWDEKNGWLPLKQSDIENANSRNNVQSLGGDSRYGILFVTESEAVDFFRTLNVYPIGYQPFMRCSAQSGYHLTMDCSDDLYTNLFFRKYKFRLTEDLCNAIYQAKNFGKLIYPNDGLDSLSDILKDMQESNTISMPAFINTYQKYPLRFAKPELIRKLKEKRKINIKENRSYISSERLKSFNKQWSNFDYASFYGFENVERPALFID